MINDEIFFPPAPAQESPLKLATVVDVSEEVATVKFDGEDESSGKKYHMIASCSLSSGDRVIVAIISGSGLILGNIKK